MELIDKQAVIDAILSHVCFDGNEGKWRHIIEDIWLKDVPTAQPRKGKWRAFYHGEHAKTMFSYSCSICGMPSPDNSEWSYCPNCGARMEESDGLN